mmetsp:Transcript_44768/g.72944  ORF Transcript_44768/g.72944 Transcript_44768/m.72944 type:complete len:264 (-) Transcript_44768:864-1655(-)
MSPRTSSPMSPSAWGASSPSSGSCGCWSCWRTPPSSSRSASSTTPQWTRRGRAWAGPSHWAWLSRPSAASTGTWACAGPAWSARGCPWARAGPAERPQANSTYTERQKTATDKNKNEQPKPHNKNKQKAQNNTETHKKKHKHMCKVGGTPPRGKSKDKLNSKRNSIPCKNTQENSVTALNPGLSFLPSHHPSTTSKFNFWLFRSAQKIRTKTAPKTVYRGGILHDRTEPAYGYKTSLFPLVELFRLRVKEYFLPPVAVGSVLT